jgi:hypothetical protein
LLLGSNVADACRNPLEKPGGLKIYPIFRRGRLAPGGSHLEVMYSNLPVMMFDEREVVQRPCTKTLDDTADDYGGHWGAVAG